MSCVGKRNTYPWRCHILASVPVPLKEEEDNQYLLIAKHSACTLHAPCGDSWPLLRHAPCASTSPCMLRVASRYGRARYLLTGETPANPDVMLPLGMLLVNV